MTALARDDQRVAEFLNSRRSHRVKRTLIYLVVIVLVVLSIKTTIIDDTDWERLGSFSNVLSSVGEFLQVDWGLLPNL